MQQIMNSKLALVDLTTSKIIKTQVSKPILIIGDLILDSYTVGHVNRISPEAPVPVLEFEFENNSLGGAANVALNIKALGANVIPVGVVGQDEAGEKLMELFQQHSISTDGIVVCDDRITTVKTRIMAAGQQLLRLDKERTNSLALKEQEEFIAKATRILQFGGITGVVFQDYNKGVLSDEVIFSILEVADKMGIPVTVDPKFHLFWAYKGVEIFKPNLKEVVQILGHDVKPDIDSLRQASKIIREKLGAKAVLITLSEKGIFYDDGINQEIISTKDS